MTWGVRSCAGTSVPIRISSWAFICGIVVGGGQPRPGPTRLVHRGGSDGGSVVETGSVRQGYRWPESTLHWSLARTAKQP